MAFTQRKGLHSLTKLKGKKFRKNKKVKFKKLIKSAKIVRKKRKNCQTVPNQAKVIR